ncbi:ubiquitin-conjugating enzyme E2 2-like [Hibiscus syriacus]|uniref:Ubiquitin-conjugating enzyme E2 2-like n=1 Tax=Hibiscus syriacus TaxID=106335 RepID=A0A6A3A5U7_HIBSY|nr:ubiquitin-conjugating enzyme E2 2-like [Hibiscus syriacus]
MARFVSHSDCSEFEEEFVQWHFPELFNRLVNLRILALSHNHFSGEVPDLSSLTNLQKLDLEDNSFGLDFLGLATSWSALYWERTGNENQHPFSFCYNEALAVGILPHQKKSKTSKVALAMAITGGIIGGIVVICFVFMFVRRSNAGALGLPAYRTFSLEELEVATNNFDTTAFMGEGSQGHMYRGRLKDGTFVAIRCLKMKKSHSTQSFMHHVELISKLRYRHLVSALGHCFECYLDDSSVSRIFLIFEYVPNGSLRSWISGGNGKHSLTWAQRISAAIGIAKGIQFLHTGIVPETKDKVWTPNKNFILERLLSSNSPVCDRIYCYSILQVGRGTSAPHKDSSTSTRERYDDESDVYDFGVILLEMILGRPSKSRKQVQILKKQAILGTSNGTQRIQTINSLYFKPVQLEAITATDDVMRRLVADPAVRTSCSDQSLKTMMEICVRCLVKNPAERPSVDDVLWNLQFAAQVQDAWKVDSQSSEGSPGSPFEPPHRVAFAMETRSL